MMNNEIILHSLTSFLPSQCLPQNEIVEWTLKSHIENQKINAPGFDQEEFSRKLRRFSLNESYISQRYFECDEVNENWKDHEIFHIAPETPVGSTIGVKNKFFGKTVLRVLKEAYPDNSPEHLVHVTCTGYISPSPAQEYFAEIEARTQITHAYHMGCYASLPAIRLGAGISFRESKTVDVLHTEMCSLHLNPGLHTPEQMVVQSLFADGHIKYSLGEAKEGFQVIAIREQLVKNSYHDMTWIPDANGMMMTLSREVPFKIRDALPEFIKELVHEAGLSIEDVLKTAIFAVHPGGPKIIEAVQKKLELTDAQVKAGKEVLFQRGNMSSATLPHVWKVIWDEGVRNNQLVVSLAFGPGLTIFGAIFRVKR